MSSESPRHSGSESHPPNFNSGSPPPRKPKQPDSETKGKQLHASTPSTASDFSQPDLFADEAEDDEGYFTMREEFQGNVGKDHDHNGGKKRGESPGHSLSEEKKHPRSSESELKRSLSELKQPLSEDPELKVSPVSLSLMLHPSHSCVWPSAKLLSEYILGNPQLISGKSVVELGCGLGLPSVAAAVSGARDVCATDICERYLRGLERMVRYNRRIGNVVGAEIMGSTGGAVATDTAGAVLQSEPEVSQMSQEALSQPDSSFPLRTRQVDWFASQENEIWLSQEENFDVCLCADVNYISNTVDALVDTIVKTRAKTLILVSKEGRVSLNAFVERILEEFPVKIVDRERLYCEKREIGTEEGNWHSLWILERE